VTVSGSGTTSSLTGTVTVLTAPGGSPIAEAPVVNDVATITVPVDTLLGDGISFGEHILGIAFLGSGDWSQVSAQGTLIRTWLPTRQRPLSACRSAPRPR
jgi:hypothetical protein